MNTRILKLVLVWNAALTAILIASLAINANFAMAANDPPVQVFTATADHAGGLDGSASTNNVTITSDTTWTTLTSVSINFGTQSHAHQCVAVASADVINPFTGASHNAYRFDITLDSTSSGTDTGSGRTLDFVNNALGSTNQNVNTTRAFFSIPNGSHTVRFVAQKFAGGQNAISSDASMSVICMKVLQ